MSFLILCVLLNLNNNYKNQIANTMSSSEPKPNSAEQHKIGTKCKQNSAIFKRPFQCSFCIFILIFISMLNIVCFIPYVSLLLWTGSKQPKCPRGTTNSGMGSIIFPWVFMAQPAQPSKNLGQAGQAINTHGQMILPLNCLKSHFT